MTYLALPTFKVSSTSTRAWARTGADGAAALADGEPQAGLHGHRVNELKVGSDIVAWHHHLHALRQLHLACAAGVARTSAARPNTQTLLGGDAVARHHHLHALRQLHRACEAGMRAHQQQGKAPPHTLCIGACPLPVHAAAQHKAHVSSAKQEVFIAETAMTDRGCKVPRAGNSK